METKPGQAAEAICLYGLFDIVLEDERDVYAYGCMVLYGIEHSHSLSWWIEIEKLRYEEMVGRLVDVGKLSDGCSIANRAQILSFLDTAQDEMLDVDGHT